MTTTDELATFVQQVVAVMDGIRALTADPSVTHRVDVPSVEGQRAGGPF